jgi:hypothetical protein
MRVFENLVAPLSVLIAAAGTAAPATSAHKGHAGQHYP